MIRTAILPLVLIVALASLAGCGSTGAPVPGEQDRDRPLVQGRVTMKSTIPTRRGSLTQERSIEVVEGRIVVDFIDDRGRHFRGEATRGAWWELWDSLEGMDPFDKEPSLLVEGADPQGSGPYHLIELQRGADSHSFSAQLQVSGFGMFASSNVDDALVHANRIAEFVARFATEQVSTD